MLGFVITDHKIMDALKTYSTRAHAMLRDHFGQTGTHDGQLNRSASTTVTSNRFCLRTAAATYSCCQFSTLSLNGALRLPQMFLLRLTHVRSSLALSAFSKTDKNDKGVVMQMRDVFWLGTGIAAGFALGAALPKLREEFGPIIREASSRAREMASEMTADFADKMQQSQDQQAGTVWTETQERAAS